MHLQTACGRSSNLAKFSNCFVYTSGQSSIFSYPKQPPSFPSPLKQRRSLHLTYISHSTTSATQTTTTTTLLQHTLFSSSILLLFFRFLTIHTTCLFFLHTYIFYLYILSLHLQMNKFRLCPFYVFVNIVFFPFISSSNFIYTNVFYPLQKGDVSILSLMMSCIRIVYGSMFPYASLNSIMHETRGAVHDSYFLFMPRSAPPIRVRPAEMQCCSIFSATTLFWVLPNGAQEGGKPAICRTNQCSLFYLPALPCQSQAIYTCLVYSRFGGISLNS